MERVRHLHSRFSSSYFAKFVVAAAAYALAVHIGLTFVASPGAASAAWPAAGVGIALLWFWGLELWPALVVGIGLVLYFVRGVELPLIVSTAGGDAVESIIAVYLMRAYVGFSPMMNRLRDTLGLMAAAIAGTLASATLITAGVWIFRTGHFDGTLWLGLFIGHFVSIISFGPFLLRWLERPFFTKTSEEVIEGVALFGSIFTLSFLMSWTQYTSIGGIALLYILIVPLIWAALRSGPRGMTLALFIFTVVIWGGILFGYGPSHYSVHTAQAVFGVQMIVGTLAMIFLLFTSITEERKEAVVTLEGHVAQLEHALMKISSEDQAKSDFIAILAHELRNPLSPILSGVELLKTQQSAPMDVLHMMGAHLNTIARLLDDLLDISRISQKRFRLQKEQVEIHDIVNRTVEMVTPQMVAKRHTLSVSTPEEKVYLNADPVRLAQTIVNLLTNAARYTEPGGRIALSVRREEGDLIVEVADNGIGIPPERLPNIFEPFGGTDLAAGVRPAGGGLRIGLSLAKRMTEMHHGTLSVMSAGEGKGSTFTLRMPLPPTMQLPLEGTPRAIRGRGRFSREYNAQASEKLGHLKVLVVDDNEPAALGLKKLLEHSGHEVVASFDAPQALADAEKFRPEVAILDIGLPSMDGYELGRLMRARFGRELIMLALTGYGQSEDKQRAAAAGFDEHLVKPISISDVQRVLVELRGRR